MKYYLIILALCLASCSNKKSKTDNVSNVFEPTRLSSWEIGQHTNEYGETTDSHFIYQIYDGYIKWNTSNGSSPLKAIIMIKKNSEKLFRWVEVKLADGQNYPLIGRLDSNSKIKFKNEKGKELEVDIYGSDGSYDFSNSQELLPFLKEGGTFSVVGHISTVGDRAATLHFDISKSFGLQELIDSVYKMENTDTIVALRNEFVKDSINAEWQKKHGRR